MNGDRASLPDLPAVKSRSDWAPSWEIDGVVDELRELRSANRGGMPAPPSVKLPSPRSLARVVEGLSSALFPNRLGRPDLSEEGVDYFVGATLDEMLGALHEQVLRELTFAAGLSNSRPVRSQSRKITREFALALPEVRRLSDTDILAAYHGDPAARSVDEVLVCYPGIVAMTHHRLAHVLHNLGAPLLGRIIAELAHSATGIDIHPGATIGESFFIDHGTGVVIGESCIIGQRVRVYQAVTLGAKRFEQDADGKLVKGEPRHPIVGDDVVIYAGATILGRITIGARSTIGGNVWVTRSIPPGSHITQAKTRNEAFDEGSGI